jgi:hypothetical protein
MGREQFAQCVKLLNIFICNKRLFAVLITLCRQCLFVLTVNDKGRPWAALLYVVVLWLLDRLLTRHHLPLNA